MQTDHVEDGGIFVIHTVVTTSASILLAIKSEPLNQTDWRVEVHFIGGKSYDYLLLCRCIFIVSSQPSRAYTVECELTVDVCMCRVEGPTSLYCSLASINSIKTILYLADATHPLMFSLCLRLCYSSRFTHTHPPHPNLWQQNLFCGQNEWFHKLFTLRTAWTGPNSACFCCSISWNQHSRVTIYKTENYHGALSIRITRISFIIANSRKLVEMVLSAISQKQQVKFS